MNRVLVTGGAGFIGSHLVDRLVQQREVVVLDDLSGGKAENIHQHMEDANFRFIKGDIGSVDDVDGALEDVETVYHFAAQPDVRLSVREPMLDFRINVVGSMNLLERLRKKDISRIVFASSGGTVYGDPDSFPTPEESPLAPISNYGASKCAFEMYLSSYAELYGMSAVSLRLANIIGPRLTHGIIYDFYLKLKSNPKRLEVLGTGRQEKAYMYVSDTVDATILLENKMMSGHLAVNVSSGERLMVSSIAEIVCRHLNVPDARVDFSGSQRGWAGDVVVTDPDIGRLRSLGWKPRISLKEGIAQYLNWLTETYGPIR